MRRHDRKARRALASLGLVALLVSLGANGSARAQTEGTPSDADLAAQFGGFQLSARGNGLLFAIDAEGFIPGNPRVFQLGLPEAQATATGGPSTFALASLAYPGSVLGDLPSLLAQTGAPPEAVAPVPNYPVQARAYFPAGPTKVDQSIAGTTSSSTVAASASDGVVAYNGQDLPAFITTSGMSVHANTHLETGRAVSQVRAEISDVDLLAGVLHIGSVVTDLRADTDGKLAGAAGTTVVTGAKFLGLDATIDGTGVHIVDPAASPPTTQKPNPLLDPVLGPLGLGPVATALQGLASGLSTVISSTVGATGTLNDFLAQTGISIKLLTPEGNLSDADPASDSGATANRTANGLSIELRYNPKTDANLQQLFTLVHSLNLPTDALIPGVPLNTSPAGLVSLLEQVYGITISLVPAAVSSQSNPPFGGLDEAVPSFDSTGDTGSGGGDFPAGSDFASGPPVLGGNAPPPSTLGDSSPIAVFGDTIPALVILLILLSLPFWAMGSTRLADNALAATSSSCPDGLDRPDPGGGP